MLAELRPITYEMEHSGVTIADMSNIMRNWVKRQPTLTPQNEPPARETGGRLMRHQYTRAELESITRETPLYLEGVGLAQIQWGGWEIAEGCRDGMLYCKHIKPFALELYGKYWVAFDGPPNGEENTR